jgi:hypothetical protein
MAVIGGVLVAGSVVSLNYPDFSKWFPVFLIIGAVLAWKGVSKYRAA